MGGIEEVEEGQRRGWIHWRGNFALGAGWALPYRRYLLGAVGAALGWGFPWKLKTITTPLLPRGCSSPLRN